MPWHCVTVAVAQCTWCCLQEAVAAHGDLKFFEADKDGAVARFGTPGDAEKAKNALEEAKTEFGGQVPTYSVMEGAPPSPRRWRAQRFPSIT